MSKVYKHPPYSGWREFVLWLGMGPFLFAGWIVGTRYFNKLLNEMNEGADPISPDDPAFRKGWVEEDTQTGKLHVVRLAENRK